MSGKLSNILRDSIKTAAPVDEAFDLGEVVVTAPRRSEATSGFSLSSFLTEINSQSILESSRHLMIFTLPKGLLEHYDSNSVKQVALRCDASSLPGISFAESEEIRRYGVGPTEKHPYLPIFGAISASYIVDGSGAIHSFFYDWMSFIVGFDSSAGMAAVNGFGRNPYEVAYKDDYKSQVTIFVYNELNDKVMEVILNNAYPIAINPVPLSWANTDQFMKLDITWDYTDWSIKYHTPVRSQGDVREGPQALARNINTQEPLLNRFAQLTGSLPPNLGLQSLVSKAGSVTQRIADIQNLVSGTKQTIVNSVKKRFGF